MSVIMPISTAMKSNFTTNNAVLLRDIHLVFRPVGDHQIIQIEEKIQEKPSFLPYFYTLPQLDIKLNLVRALSDTTFEFGGIMGEQAISALVQILPGKITTRISYLKDQAALFGTTINAVSHLQVA